MMTCNSLRFFSHALTDSWILLNFKQNVVFTPSASAGAIDTVHGLFRTLITDCSCRVRLTRLARVIWALPATATAGSTATVLRGDHPHDEPRAAHAHVDNWRNKRQHRNRSLPIRINIRNRIPLHIGVGIDSAIEPDQIFADEAPQHPIVSKRTTGPPSLIPAGCRFS